MSHTIKDLTALLGTVIAVTPMMHDSGLILIYSDGKQIRLKGRSLSDYTEFVVLDIEVVPSPKEVSNG